MPFVPRYNMNNIIWGIFERGVVRGHEERVIGFLVRVEMRKKIGQSFHI